MKRIAAAVVAIALAGCGPDFYEHIPCDSDDNCPQGLFCDEGVCSDDAPPRECASNLDCPKQQHCDPERRVCVTGPQPEY